MTQSETPSPSKRARSTPKRSPKSARKPKASPKSVPGKRKAAGSAPSAAPASKVGIVRRIYRHVRISSYTHHTCLSNTCNELRTKSYTSIIHYPPYS